MNMDIGEKIRYLAEVVWSHASDNPNHQQNEGH